jgi:prevent-host-death family protein
LCVVVRDEDAGEVVKVPSAQVGVRELRQNLSVYLRRVKAGESLEVLERGHVVAVLTPVKPASTALERLIAAGLATRPARSLADVRPPRGPVSDVLSRALLWVREDRT